MPIRFVSQITTQFINNKIHAIMKTILFFYNDVLLKREVCDAYICPASNVDQIINWKHKCYEREIREGYYTSLSIKIIDKLDTTMMLQ